MNRIDLQQKNVQLRLLINILLKRKDKKMVIATTHTGEMVKNEGTRENGTSTGSELTA